MFDWTRAIQAGPQLVLLILMVQFYCASSQNEKNSLLSNSTLPKRNESELSQTDKKETLPTQAQLVDKERIRKFNATRLSSQGKLLLRLIKLIHDVSRNQNGSTTNSSIPSESRSMSTIISWFRQKKANAQRKEGFMFGPNGYDYTGHPHSDHHRPIPHSHHHHHNSLPGFVPGPVPLRPEFLYDTLPESENPNSFAFFPPMTDTGSIDYWLKLIENANIEEKDYSRLNSDKSLPEIKKKERKVKKSKIKKSNKQKKIEVPVLLNNSEDDDDDEGNYINSGSKQKLIKPIEYDTSPRCDKFTDDICIDDFEYPEHAIIDEIFKRKDLFQLMYSEVKGDTPLVDGMSRDMEENFSSDYYYNNDPDAEDYDGYYDSFNKTSQDEAQTEPKRDKITFVCRSEVLYAKPKLAKNIKGKWRVIVNAGEFTQTVRMEKCNKPNSQCRFIADDKYDSRCAQISAIHRLLVFEKGKGFYIDTFRIPTACTCHIQTAKQYRPSFNKPYNSDYPTESSNSINVRKEKLKSNLGQTLWTLIESDKQSKKDAIKNYKDPMENEQFLQLSDQTQNINTDLIKLLPHLSLMAPENVLQQLLEGYGNEQEQSKSYVMPSYQQAELIERIRNAPSNEPHFYSPQNGKSKHKQYSGDHSGGTTIVTKTRHSGSHGPIVQVILPLASAINQQNTNPVISSYLQNDFNDRTDYYQKSDTQNLNKMVNSNSPYLELHSTPNSTVTEPSLAVITSNVTLSTKNSSSLGRTNASLSIVKNSKDNKDIKKNKKINFAYHPIFEYIVD